MRALKINLIKCGKRCLLIEMKCYLTVLIIAPHPLFRTTFSAKKRLKWIWGNAEEKLCLKAIQTLSRLDLSRTASLDPTDGQSFAALGCTGNYDKSEQMMMKRWWHKGWQTKATTLFVNIMIFLTRSSFSALHAVCESCYQLYREPEVHSLCRSTSDHSN